MKRKANKVAVYEARIRELEEENKAITRQKSELEKRINKLEHLVVIDELTGALRKGCFTKRASEEIDRAERDNTSFGFGIIDLDHFKEINDRYGGHPAGDHILSTFARFVRDEVRSYDLLFRYGGDEFALLLPRISMREVEERLRALQQNTEKTSFVYERTRIPLTISVGGTLYVPRRGFTVEDIVRTADNNLYLAKETRNATVLSETLNKPRA